MDTETQPAGPALDTGARAARPLNRVSSAITAAVRDPVHARRFAAATAGAFGVWLLLVGTLDPSEWLVGLVVALVTAYLSLPRLELLDGFKPSLAMPWHILKYLVVFLRALVQSNIDMARRVLAPSLPIRPAIVEVHTELKSPLGKLLLANSITLTPGTLSVDIVGDRLWIHWIDITPGADTVSATRAIAADFERLLKEFVR